MVLPLLINSCKAWLLLLCGQDKKKILQISIGQIIEQLQKSNKMVWIYVNKWSGFFLFKIIHLISHKHTLIGKSFFPLFVLNNTLLNIKDEQKNSVSFMQIKVGIVMVNL